MSTNNSSNGFEDFIKFVAGVIALIFIVGIIIIAVKFAATWVGFLVGVVLAFIVALLIPAGLGLGIGVAAVGVQHAVGFGIRRSISIHRLEPGAQLLLASVPAVLLVGVLVFASNYKFDPGRASYDEPRTYSLSDDVSLGERWSSGMDSGKHTGYMPGLWVGLVGGIGIVAGMMFLSGPIVYAYAELHYLYPPNSAAGPSTQQAAASGPAASATATPPPPPKPKPASSASSAGKAKTTSAELRVQRRIDAAAIGIQVVEGQLHTRMKDLGSRWHNLTDAMRQEADIVALSKKPDAVTDALINKHQASAENDLREVQAILPSWGKILPLLSAVKNELGQVKADPNEIERLRDFMKIALRGMRDCLLSRDWGDCRVYLSKLPDAIHLMSPYVEAAVELGFSDLSEVNTASLQKRGRIRLSETHPDKNPGDPDSSIKFERVKKAQGRLKIYLQHHKGTAA